MKRIVVSLLIMVLSSSLSIAAETNPRELLAKVDVSHPYYKNKVYGRDKAAVYHSKDKSVLLVYQARYGGDGEHTENILKLFKFHGNKATKLLDQNIDDVQFVVQDVDVLKQIKGKYVETLCDVCDGWEVSDPEDLFFIPITIDIDSLRIKTTLTKKEKKELAARLEQVSQKSITEQLSYGNKNYPAYVAEVKNRVKAMLQRK